MRETAPTEAASRRRRFDLGIPVRLLCFPLALGLAVVPLPGQRALIDTVIGGGLPQTPFFEGVAAANAAIYGVQDTALDSSGNLFVSDRVAHRVIRVDRQSGTASVYAGTGEAGFSGDEGQARLARLKSPAGLAVDRGGALFIMDAGNNRIRRVDPATRTISTYAGTGVRENSGNGGPALEAGISLVTTNKAVFDPAGRLVFTTIDSVRRVDSQTGLISTIAGGGPSVNRLRDGESALSSFLFGCRSIQFAGNGDFYLSTNGTYLVKVAAPSGVLEIVAGTGQYANTGDGGPGRSAAVQPGALLLESAESLVFASARLIRRINLKTGIVTPVEPSGPSPAPRLALGNVSTLLATAPGVWLVADSYDGLSGSNRVLELRPATWAVTVAAGNGALSFLPNEITDWRAFPLRISDMALHPNGKVVFAAENRIFTADARTGIVQRIAGTGIPGSSGDGGPALDATVGNQPRLHVSASGDIYFLDFTGPRIRRIDGRSGVIATVAGNGSSEYLGDGKRATETGFAIGVGSGGLCGPATDRAGNVYFAHFNFSTGTGRIARVDASTGVITTHAGGRAANSFADGTPAAEAILGGVCHLVFDDQENMYFSETYGSSATLLRKIDRQTGRLATVTATTPYYPQGLYRTPAGDFYFSHNASGSAVSIHRFNLQSKSFERIVGGASGYAGDGGVASSALIGYAGSLALDADRNLVFADSGNGRIRKLSFVSGDQPLFGPGAVVNAASLSGSAGVAPGSWVSVFGDGLATALKIADGVPLPPELGGSSVRITDAAGRAYQAALQFVSPAQINFLVPPEIGAGVARMTVVRGGSASAEMNLRISPFAPGLFSANANATGVAAGFAVYAYPDGRQEAIPLFTYNEQLKRQVFNPIAIPNVGPVLYVTLYGTGWRGAAPGSVRVAIGGEDIPVLYVGAQGGFDGLDQLNIGPIPAALKKQPGETDIVISSGGINANVVQIGLF